MAATSSARISSAQRSSVCGFGAVSPARRLANEETAEAAVDFDASEGAEGRIR
jgi:hypothetical protein